MTWREGGRDGRIKRGGEGRNWWQMCLNLSFLSRSCHLATIEELLYGPEAVANSMQRGERGTARKTRNNGVRVSKREEKWPCFYFKLGVLSKVGGRVVEKKERERRKRLGIHKRPATSFLLTAP